MTSSLVDRQRGYLESAVVAGRDATTLWPGLLDARRIWSDASMVAETAP